MDSMTDDAQVLDKALAGKVLSGDFVVPISVVWDGSFKEMRIENFTLTGGSFSCSSFVECYFLNASFIGTSFEFVAFEKCRFENVIFEKCLTEGMRLINCKTVNMKFS